MKEILKNFEKQLKIEVYYKIMYFVSTFANLKNAEKAIEKIKSKTHALFHFEENKTIKTPKKEENFENN